MCKKKAGKVIIASRSSEVLPSTTNSVVHSWFTKHHALQGKISIIFFTPENFLLKRILNSKLDRSRFTETRIMVSKPGLLTDFAVRWKCSQWPAKAGGGYRANVDTLLTNKLSRYIIISKATNLDFHSRENQIASLVSMAWRCLQVESKRPRPVPSCCVADTALWCPHFAMTPCKWNSAFSCDWRKPGSNLPACPDHIELRNHSRSGKHCPIAVKKRKDIIQPI